MPLVIETKLEMASSQSESLHLHLDESNISENETNIVVSSDLNVTWDYSDESSMETGITTQGKRPRPLSDSENSDSYEHDERVSTKKHNVSGSTFQTINEYQSQNQNVVVFIESNNVNLSKTNPIFIAKTINDLVGHVQKVINTQNGLKIICKKSQANILCKEKRFGMYNCHCTIKSVPKPKIKGICHGIPKDMDLEEIKEELENANSLKIEQIYRMQKYDKIKQEKTDTDSIIIEYGQDIEFPLQMYLGYRRIYIKQFIPFPTRCFKCQKFGHVSKNCRSKAKCPNCGEEHKFEDCNQKEIKKCCNCGLNHSAGYKGCEAFLKAKQIKEYSYNKKITYAEATKQITKPTNTSSHAVQQEKVLFEANNEHHIVSKMNSNEDQIVTKVIEKIQTNNKENEGAIVEKVVEQVKTQAKHNEQEFIDQMLEKIRSKTSDYEQEITDKITEKIMSTTQNSCKCGLTPETIFVFFFRAMKYFKDESFIRKSSDSQIRHLAHLFRICTHITLNQDKVYDILHS